MKGFVCGVCGFVAIDGAAPDNCPVCHAPKTSFAEKEDAAKTPVDAKNLTELEKKHIPVINVVKKCGLIPEGCEDVHVKLGEIQHPMLPEHSIQHIDFYIDKKFVSRVILTPLKNRIDFFSGWIFCCRLEMLQPVIGKAEQSYQTAKGFEHSSRARP